MQMVSQLVRSSTRRLDEKQMIGRLAIYSSHWMLPAGKGARVPHATKCALEQRLLSGNLALPMLDFVSSQSSQCEIHVCSDLGGSTVDPPRLLICLFVRIL